MIKRFAIVEYETEENNNTLDSYSLTNFIQLPNNCKVIDTYPYGSSMMIVGGNIASGFSFLGPFGPKDFDYVHSLSKKLNGIVMNNHKRDT